MPDRIELSGMRFGRWLVVGYAGKQKWQCICDCGAERSVDGHSLRSGASHSCLRCSRNASHSRRTHGGSSTRLYNIWCGMKRRCFNVRDAAYKRYGARGITVCVEWRSSFAAFREWALSSGYADHLSIDRINNDAGYLPENCRWATAKQQNRNYSRNVTACIDGKRVALVDVAEAHNIKPHTLRQRIRRYGLSATEAIAKGPHQPLTVERDGQQVLLRDLCRNAGLSVPMVKKRLDRGWDLEKALRP